MHICVFRYSIFMQKQHKTPTIVGYVVVAHVILGVKIDDFITVQSEGRPPYIKKAFSSHCTIFAIAMSPFLHKRKTNFTSNYTYICTYFDKKIYIHTFIKRNIQGRVRR